MHEADKRAGRAIKTCREELEPRITQEELAFSAEVSPSLITKLECGSQLVTQMKAVNLYH